MLKKTFFISFAVLFTFLVCASVATSTASAQSTPEPAVDLPLVQTQSVDLPTLREQYKTQLAIYRTDERAFDLAKEQYKKLGTLTSLEVAVKATQKVMLSRADVLITYSQMLSAILSQTSGIDVAQKAALIQDHAAMQERLKEHKEVTKLAVDRLALADAVEDFDAFSDPVSRVSYKSLSYIAYGPMQNVYDKTVAIRGEITTELEAQETNSLRLAEKRRALEEIDRIFISTTERLQGILKTINVEKRFEARFTQTSYNQTTDQLGKVYAEIFQVITFFREVEKS